MYFSVNSSPEFSSTPPLGDEPVVSPLPAARSTPYSNSNYEQESIPSPLSSSSSSASKISPVLLLVIVILAIIFFICGLIHLLFRCFNKNPFFSFIYHSDRYSETSISNGGFPRQLQQLFRLHDSGLDQALIDSLPVFHYRDILGLREPFDCAVCLCEFSDHDELRLLPVCSHAFHVNCIETWLLSNSTCPLCRGSLPSPGFQLLRDPVFNFGDWRGVPAGMNRDAEKVFDVRLGKFRSTQEGGEAQERRREETGSSSHLDERRCFSMGSYSYVVKDSSLNQVRIRGQLYGCVSAHQGHLEGKRISRCGGDSFSVSKIWLWSKKRRMPSSCTDHFGLPLKGKRSVVEREV